LPSDIKLEWVGVPKDLPKLAFLFKEEIIAVDLLRSFSFA